VARPGPRPAGEGGTLYAVSDGQIAGIAGAEGLTVVTENTSDFEPFSRLEGGIDVENWGAQ